MNPETNIIEFAPGTSIADAIRGVVGKALDHAQGVFDVFHYLLPQMQEAKVDLGFATSFIEYTWVEQTCARAGNKVYEITEALAEKLLHTELRGVGQQDLALPFAGFKLYLPRVAKHQIFAHLGMPEWIYVARSESNVRIENTLLHGVSLHSVAINETSVFTSYVSLDKDQDLSHIKKKPVKDELTPLFDVRPAYAGSDNKDVETAGQWLANVILYITSREQRAVATGKEYLALSSRIDKLPPGPKKEKLKARRRSLDPDYRIILGKDVAPLGPSREGVSLTVRTLVAGHWRNQVTGRMKDDLGVIIPAKERPHVRMWIEPFWRGPELAEVTNPIREARS